MRNEKQQKLFALEYIKDFNATQAAKRAGYSEKTAGVQGHELLKKPEIQAMVSQHIEERANRTKVTVDMVVQELAALAFNKIPESIEIKNGKVLIKDTDELSDSAKAAISSIKEIQTENGTYLEVKFHNKEKSLELLGRHLEMFTDKKKLEAGDTLLDLLGGNDESSSKEEA